MLKDLLSAVAVVGALVVSLKVVKKAVLKNKAQGKKAAVILSGCGYLDGAETTESIAVLVALAELGVEAVVFAPDTTASVVDHQSTKSLGFAPRNLMQEAARLSRGGVRPLTELTADKYDVLVIPGGFGVAKNLSDWATAASPKECKVIPEVKRAIEEFAQAKKPIGLCCIAPVLAAICIPGCKLTLGKSEPAEKWPYGGTVGQVQSLGANVVLCEVDEVVVDHDKRVVTTPAFMCAAPKDQVFFGVRKMIHKLVWLL